MLVSQTIQSILIIQHMDLHPLYEQPATVY